MWLANIPRKEWKLRPDEVPWLCAHLALHAELSSLIHWFPFVFQKFVKHLLCGRTKPCQALGGDTKSSQTCSMLWRSSPCRKDNFLHTQAVPWTSVQHLYLVTELRWRQFPGVFPYLYLGKHQKILGFPPFLLSLPVISAFHFIIISFGPLCDKWIFCVPHLFNKYHLKDFALYSFSTVFFLFPSTLNWLFHPHPLLNQHTFFLLWGHPPLLSSPNSPWALHSSRIFSLWLFS